jgi:hypothetical protein
VPPCLPPIIPRSGMYEDAWSLNWRGGCNKVLGRCEPFVAEGEDFGPKRGGDEV